MASAARTHTRHSEAPGASRDAAPHASSSQPLALPPSTGPGAAGIWSVRDRATSTATSPGCSVPRVQPPHSASMRAPRAQRPGGGYRRVLAAGQGHHHVAHPLSAHGHTLTCSCSTQTGTRWDPAPQQDSGWRGQVGAPRWVRWGSRHLGELVEQGWAPVTAEESSREVLPLGATQIHPHPQP